VNPRSVTSIQSRFNGAGTISTPKPQAEYATIFRAGSAASVEAVGSSGIIKDSPEVDRIEGH